MMKNKYKIINIWTFMNMEECVQICDKNITVGKINLSRGFWLLN